MNMKNRVLWIILSLVILAALSTRAQGGTMDIGIPDTVSIDSVTAYLSGVGVVPVRFFNDEPLTAIEVTLKKSSSSVALDSISFASSRIAALTLIKGLSRNLDGTFTIYVQALTEVIPAGTGLLCRLYFSYADNIPPQVVAIDSTTFVDGQLEKGVWFTDTIAGSEPYHPRFRKGYLNVQVSPPSHDSLWVANITAARGQHASVDVSLYNERNVKNVDIVLSYGNDRLTFDSVSFIGTRSGTGTYQSDPATHAVYIGINFGEAVPLVPGTGTIARLWLTVAGNTPDTTITIDSTTFLSLLSTALTLTSVDANRQITPIFRAGSVAVQGSTGVNDGQDQLPETFALAQNYPNPFNPTTEIEFALPSPGVVHLDIYNVMGQRVRELVGGYLPAGHHRLTFDSRSEDGRPLSSGVYFYRLIAGANTETRKMLLVK
jgi:hypothetical protein